MTILVDFGNVVGSYTGIPRATQDDVVAMLKGGMSPTLWTTQRTGSTTVFFDLDIELTTDELQRVHIDPTRPRNRAMWVGQFLPTRNSPRKVRRLVSLFPGYARGSRDIIRMHDPFGQSGSILKEALTWNARPKVVLARTLRTAAFRIACDGALVVPNSQATADRIKSIYQRQSLDIRVVPNAVGGRLVGSVSSTRLRQPYFLMVGGTRQRKRPDVLINQWAKDYPTLRASLVIVGDVSFDLLSENAVALHQIGRLVFYSNVSTINLRKLQSKALASVFLSEGEGFGRPIAESLLVGTPVIANDLNVFREFDTDFVSLFDLSNSLHLSQLLYQARRPIDSKATGACMKYGDLFSYESVGKLWARILEGD